MVAIGHVEFQAHGGVKSAIILYHLFLDGLTTDNTLLGVCSDIITVQFQLCLHTSIFCQDIVQLRDIFANTGLVQNLSFEKILCSAIAQNWRGKVTSV